MLVGDNPMSAVCDIRGGAPGTRDVATLDAVTLVGQADAIVLSRRIGLRARRAGGRHLRPARAGRGFEIAPARPECRSCRVRFFSTLANGGEKDWGEEAPYRALGARAVAAAAEDFALGNAGAGYGAVAGKYKGGLGSVSAVTDDGFTVGALAAVNAVGSPLIPGTGVFWAFPFEQNGEFGGRRAQPRT